MTDSRTVSSCSICPFSTRAKRWPSPTDVLFLKPFSGLFRLPDDRITCLFMQDSQNSYSLRPWHMVGRWGIRLPKRLNGGVFSYLKSSFNLPLLEDIISRGLSGVLAIILAGADVLWCIRNVAAVGVLVVRTGCGAGERTRPLGSSRGRSPDLVSTGIAAGGSPTTRRQPPQWSSRRYP